MRNTAARGFTLIELVVVITILGVLAAFAIPRFISVDASARAATVNGLAGTITAAAAEARSLSMATGSTASVSMETNSVTFVDNYPDAGTTGIMQAAIVSTDFTFTPGAPVSTGTATWTRNGAPTPADCAVSYTPPAAGNAPVVAAVVTGC